MNAMIFAAGLGTRLRPLTNDRPKALVEVNGKTLLEHNIVKLKEAGFDRIVVNIHHFGEQIIEFLNAHDNFGIDIRVSDERQQLLDTGGGIKHAIPLFDQTQPILIHNVDIISDIDVRELYAKHLDSSMSQKGASPLGATLAVHQRKTSRYLQFADNMHLCGWTNVKTGEVKGERGEPFAFAGIHVVDPNLLPYLQVQAEDVFSIIDFYLKVCNQIAIAGSDVTGREWVDCGKPEALAKAAQLTSNK
jgi:NDP-sugar pyrophosphorylase family protein